MRKITKLAVKKFLNQENFNMGNTSVWNGYERSKSTPSLHNRLWSRMLLHDNEIASKEQYSDSILIDTCGWFSTTTKERLNGLLDTLGLPKIQQKNFKWYLMGREWNGNEVRIDIRNQDWEYEGS